MSRYIDADALMMRVNGHGTNKFGILHDVDIREFINKQPTVDAVQVVRCGECIYRSQTLTHSWCTNSKSCCHGCLVRKDFFCADGERKEKESERFTGK